MEHLVSFQRYAANRVVPINAVKVIFALPQLYRILCKIVIVFSKAFRYELKMISQMPHQPIKIGAQLTSHPHSLILKKIL